MFIGAISGFLAILIGAFGAHALKDTMSVYGLSVFQTAWDYHALHTLVLLIIPLSPLNLKQTKILILLFTTGMTIFSGSLYILAVTEIRVLGAITPVGGILLLCGWLYLCICLKKGNHAA